MASRRNQGVGVLALVVGLLLFLGMVSGLRQAVGGGDPSAFFVTPFLLTAALVCLGVGLHKLWGHRPPSADPADPPPDVSPDDPAPRD
jgi:hypothetical protein